MDRIGPFLLLTTLGLHRIHFKCHLQHKAIATSQHIPSISEWTLTRDMWGLSPVFAGTAERGWV